MPDQIRSSGATYGARIARGPMGGDSFTQIHRNLFRDPRLSAKAKGIFGLCSTHAAGWHLTLKSIARDMRDGVDACAGGLQELERYGYLIRYRERNDMGQYGESIYFVTDLPAQLLDLDLPDEVVADRVRRAFDQWLEQNGMSAPERENPVQGSTSENADDDTPPVDNSGRQTDPRRSQPERDFPDLDFPDRGNPPTKKTKPKNTSSSVEQTGATLAPDPQRTDGTTSSHRRPGDHNGSAGAGTGGSVVGDHQTAREDLAVRPDSPVVNDLAILLSIASSKGLTQQQAVTRAYRELVAVTTGENFRRAVDEHLITARPAVTRDQARTEVRNQLVRSVLAAAAAQAEAAINSRGTAPDAPGVSPHQALAHYDTNRASPPGAGDDTRKEAT